MASCRVGTIAFDEAELDANVETILSLTLHPCEDAAGDWRLRTLWGEDEPDGDGELVRRRLSTLERRLGEVLRTELVRLVRVFVARDGGFIRPHRDAPAESPKFTRLHVPLRTDDACWSSEDDLVYRMAAGEIWFLDGTRPHSGGCFSRSPRVHVILDFPPLPPAELFRDPMRYQPRAPDAIARLPMGAEQRDALHGLAAIAGETNLDVMLDLLATLHVERQASCAETYDWLCDIARGSGDAALAARANALRGAYLATAAA